MQYKFGIVGTGMIAAFHAKALNSMKDGELLAVYSRSSERAKSFGEEHSCKAYTEMDTFLADPELDAVIVCTPSGAHLEPVLAAAAAGKHVVVEKPLEVTIEKVDQMISACDKAGVQLVAVLPRRFTGAASLLKDAADSGRFGQMTMVDAQIKWWRSQDYYDSGAWRGTWSLDGGGALMNQSIHTIDLLLHVAGPVKRVCAFAGLLGHSGIEVEDTAVAVLEFESGAKGVIQGSTTCYSSKGHPAQLQVCGTKGSAFMVDDRFSIWEFEGSQTEDEKVLREYGLQADSSGAGAADPSAIDYTWHMKNLEEAVAAFNEKRPPSIGGVEGRRAVELIQAIYQSAQSGGTPVELPLSSSVPMKSFE